MRTRNKITAGKTVREIGNALSDDADQTRKDAARAADTVTGWAKDAARAAKNGVGKITE